MAFNYCPHCGKELPKEPEPDAASPVEPVADGIARLLREMREDASTRPRHWPITHWPERGVIS